MVAIVSLLVDDSCHDQDSLDELLDEINYALDKEEIYYELVDDILDYYGYDDSVVLVDEEPRERDYYGYKVSLHCAAYAITNQ